LLLVVKPLCFTTASSHGIMVRIFWLFCAWQAVPEGNKPHDATTRALFHALSAGPFGRVLLLTETRRRSACVIASTSPTAKHDVSEKAHFLLESIHPYVAIIAQALLQKLLPYRVRFYCGPSRVQDNAAPLQ
jgi:hypothetical protein